VERSSTHKIFYFKDISFYVGGAPPTPPRKEPEHLDSEAKQPRERKRERNKQKEEPGQRRSEARAHPRNRTDGPDPQGIFRRSEGS